ncbi:MAG: sulfatase-like hydrolase/transferase [Spirochaetes bacterium]|nr:sulfatase-like hydrolase/transferase [Spirochaetota bacterium]
MKIQLIHTSKKIIKGLYEIRKRWIPGVVVFFILFLCSNIMNFSLSYMGNTSEEVVQQIVQRFWWKIIYYTLKIFCAYLLIGGIIGALMSISLDAIASRWLFLREEWQRILVNVLLIVFFTLMVFVHQCIIYPQLFVDNFANHSPFFSRFLELCTDSINPIFPAAIIWSIVGISFGIAAIRVYRAFQEDIKSMAFRAYQVLKKYTKVSISVGITVIAGILVFFIRDELMYAYNPAHMNILILSSDALRPDHFSGNGYWRKTTPNIDQLMRESLQFRGVISALPRTFPAWVSLLMSQYPLTHDIKHMFPRSRERNLELPTAPRFLHRKGYYTAIISDYAGDIFPRIDLGFAEVYALTFNFDVFLAQMLIEKQTFLLPFLSNWIGDFFFPQLRGIAKFSHHEAVTEETLTAIRKARNRPFFITSFYSVTHFPYAVPYPYYAMYADPAYRGPYKYYKQVILKMGDAKQDVRYMDTEADKKQIVALYDGAIRVFDSEVGKILHYLEESGLKKNTIVIITSDHGENLFEKDLGMGHGEHLKGMPSLEIPFILYSPHLKNDKGKTVHRFSSQIDIMPTVFDAARIPLPEFFHGSSLLQKKKWRDGEKVDAYFETGLWFDYDPESNLFFPHRRIVYPDVTGLLELDTSYRNELVIMQKFQNITNAAKHRGIIAGKYKLIYVPLSSGATFELYDQISDPLNERDLSKERKDVLQSMKKLFYDFIQEKSYGNLLVKDGFIFPAFSDPVF